jgi:phosphoribosylformimino-5-aminoimidazole carboxamide ribonucleotide (ProFAR) isomerase
MDLRDRVKIKRMFDLGTENIVLQTRFGIDGDVVTRIEENFANHPKEMVLSIHDRQTNLTVNYWKSLVTLIKDFVSEFFK